MKNKIKKKKIDEDTLQSIAFLIIMNGFIYYYYYMKWFKGMTATQIVTEVKTYPQDLVYILFFTVLNIVGIIYLFVVVL